MANSTPFILITGASGYVGSHAVSNFLKHGYKVRVAGRNQHTCDRMLSLHSAFGSHIEAVVVPDITVPGAFARALQGVDCVVHMASPFTYRVEDNEKNFIKPAIEGTLGILRSALKSSKVKRIVVTSSFAAVNNFYNGLAPGHTYNESQWNPITYQETSKADRLAYAGSKKLAEEAAWQFMEDNESHIPFTMATICPVMVYGPPLPGSADIKHLGQSMSEIYALMNGSLEQAPPTPMPVFVDVRDVAEAHRLAFERRESIVSASEGQERYLVCGGSFTMSDVCKLLQSRIPEIKDRVALSTAQTQEHYSVSTERAKNLLGLSFRGFEECFLDTAKALLELSQ